MKVRFYLALAWMLACVGAPLLAQTVSVAKISGAVKDAGGNLIVGAEVIAKQTDTGLTRTVKTESDGSYTIPSLPVGAYSVQASMSGFSTQIRDGIVLQVDTNPTINFNLTPGSVTQEVTVDAGVPMVDTQSTGVGSVIDNQRVNDLPLNGRHATDLLTLVGGATPAPPAAFQSPRNYPTVTVSVAGGTAAGIFFVMDGGDYNDPENNLNFPAPFPDVLQEFKVETSAVPAQFGSHSSGVVNMVTKSGTNAIHGDVFEYVRNYIFNARNYFATTRDSLKRNQFGGTIGGPIIHDKLFYMAGYQQTLIASNPATTKAYVPTAAMLAGNFQPALAAGCFTSTPTGPLASSQTLPASSVSSVALGYSKYLPSSTNPCGLITYAVPAPQSDRQGLGRIDYLLSQRQVLFGRYFYARNNQPAPSLDNDALRTAVGGVTNEVQSFVLGHTFTINPALLNSFRGTANRAVNLRLAVPFMSPTAFGVTMTPQTANYSALVVGSSSSPYFQVGSSLANSAHFNTTIYQFADDVNWSRGAHNIQLGGSYLRVLLNDQSNQYSNGQFSFSGQRTGLILGDFLLGLPNNFTQNFVQQEGQRQYVYALYAQDSWKFSQHLLVNYGLRWEPWNPMTEIHGHVERFSQSAFTAGVRSTQYVNAPAGLSFPGDSGFPGHALTNGSLDQFAPRIGIIYDRTGQGTSVWRAGYGIFYDRPTMYENTRVSTAPPFGNQTSVTNPSFTSPWATTSTYTGGDPFVTPPGKNAPFPQAGVYVTYPARTHATTTQQWNLTFQKQPRVNWSFTLSYIGNHTTHIWLSRESNAAEYIPGASTTSNTNQRRPLYLQNPSQGAYYSNVYMLDDGGTGSYNGALATVEKRFNRYYSLLANYTWSHCINDGEYYEAVGVELDYQNPYNRHANRGNCAADRRNAFNLTGIAATPDLKNRWAGAIANHWQLTAIVSAYSGDSFVPTTGGVDNALTGTSNQQPNVIGNWRLPHPGPNAWFNKSVFVPNTPGEYGNSPRGLIVGPRYTNTSMALFRSFPIFHEQAITFRAEAFNILNHTEFQDPIQTTNSAAFGQIQTANDPRIMQFALKYTF
jgi:Carboxypeptidase regulatory-like domain